MWLLGTRECPVWWDGGDLGVDQANQIGDVGRVRKNAWVTFRNPTQPPPVYREGVNTRYTVGYFRVGTPKK